MNANYWKKYYQEHKGITKHCDQCELDIDKFNFSRHCKTKKHKLMGELGNQQRETVQETVKKLLEEELIKLGLKAKA